MTADTLQGRIDMVVNFIKCLIVIVKFVADYFPKVPEGNGESRWEFYNGFLN
ncbi:MAG: hypothetical protein IJ262_04370 [Clostridia bacterium]|nr:hypothetical protein [Clostridia bacterium]